MEKLVGMFIVVVLIIAVVLVTVDSPRQQPQYFNPADVVAAESDLVVAQAVARQIDAGTAAIRADTAQTVYWPVALGVVLVLGPVILLGSGLYLWFREQRIQPPVVWDDK
jgi:hypothetical protein